MVTSTHRLPSGFSGALRLFAFWLANGTVWMPVLDDVDYWTAMREEPSLAEQVFAIFANVIELDGEGNPVNADHAGRRAAQYIHQYMTGRGAEPPFEDWEVHLY